MKQMIYIGSCKELQGETALVQRGLAGKVSVQFNNMKLEESHGWHEYDKRDFVTVEQVIEALENSHRPDVKMTIDCQCGSILVANSPWVNFPKDFEIVCSICSRKHSVRLDEGN